jgi:hypothetical protein
MTIRVAWLDVLRNLEDYSMTHKGMAMAGEQKAKQKKLWEDQGTAMCLKSLRAQDQVLEQAREIQATETQLKILETSRDRLSNIVHFVQEETDNKSKVKNSSLI